MKWDDKPYHSLDYEMKHRFGEKVYRLSLNGGMTCPNRDGKCGMRGCIFCSAGGSGDFAASPTLSISRQLSSQKEMIRKKRPVERFIAYFQAYTNTYGDLRSLQGKYEEALSVHGVVGLIIGTRPDCMSDRLLSYLSELSKKYFVLVEYGIESTCDETLKRINRGHTFSDSRMR